VHAKAHYLLLTSYHLVMTSYDIAYGNR
jgi:hypothetical protein